MTYISAKSINKVLLSVQTFNEIITLIIG
jgi:hypothetical protein